MNELQQQRGINITWCRMRAEAFSGSPLNRLRMCATDAGIRAHLS